MDNEETYSKEENESTIASSEEILSTETIVEEVDNPLSKELANDKKENSLKNHLAKFKYWKALSVLAVIILSAAIFWGVKSNNLIKSFSNKVYPESYVLGTDVSGMSKETLHSTLETLLGEIGNTKIKVNIGKKTFESTYKDIDVTIPYDDFEKKILAYGKNEGFFEKLNLIKKAEKKDYEFEFAYNEDKFKEFLTTISEDVNVSPIDGTINISGGSISVTESSGGYKLNSDELLASLKSSMKDISKKDELVLESALLPVEESIKSDSLYTVKNKISTFTTTYPVGPSGENLQIAARNIDNILLMPGDSFSCEEAIGPTTPENGFVLANTYVSGQVVKNYGGGVCQVSSTLYNTILRAGIIPTERQNHMMPVSYVPIGLDSTLADGVIDLKFTNDFDYPIVINSYAGNGSLTIEFWSDNSVLNGLRYEPKSVARNSLSADAYLYAYDANGNMVSEQFLDTSTYQPLP